MLYVLGWLVTVGGALIAYRQARKDEGRFDELAGLNSADREHDLVETYELAKAGKDEEVAAHAAVKAGRQAELEQALVAAGIDDPPPTWNDMRPPPAFWSKRSAVADAVASFKRGGLMALAGLTLSTVASVWSVYS